MGFNFLFAYYKNVSKYTCKNYYFHSLILLLEYMPLFAISVIALQHLVNQFTQTEITFQTNFYYYIIYAYSFSFFSLNTYSINQTNLLAFAPTCFYLIFIFTLLIMSCCKRKIKKLKKRKEICFKGILFKKVFFSFFDIIFFRFLNVYMCEFMIYTLTYEQSPDRLVFQYLSIILSLVSLCFHLFFCLWYYHTFHIIVKLNETDFNYPYDTYSCFYDKVIFLLKILCSSWLVLSKANETMVSFFDLVIVLYISSYAMYSVFSMRRLITNKRLNNLRMIFPIFNGLYLVLYALFGRFYSISILIVILIIIVTLTVLILFLMYHFKMNQIIQSKFLMDKTIYLIEELMNSKHYYKSNSNRNNINNENINSSMSIDKNNNQLIITKMIISHEINCVKENCNLCSFDLTKLKNDTDEKIKLLQILYKGIKQSTKENKNELFDLLQLIIHIGCVNANNHFNANFNFYQLLKKYHNENSNYSSKAMTLNIKLLHNSYLKQYTLDKKKAAILVDIIYLNQKVKELIKEFNDLLFVKDHSPITFISSSLKLKQYKQTITSYNNKKYELNQNYNLVLVWFIIENIFNSKIKNNEGVCFDLSLYEETLNENYINYKYMILHHKLGSNCFKIENSGKEFAKYVNKNIEELFLKDMQKEAIKELLSHFKQKKQIKLSFEFPIRDWHQNEFIQSFRIRFLAFPSITCEDLLINGIYKVDYEDLIVFILDKHDSSLWNLYSYSRKLEKEMFVSIELLNELHQNQKYIDLLTVFSPKNEINLTQQLYEINYKKYYKQLVSYLKYDLNKNTLGQMKSSSKSIVMNHKMTVKGVNHTYKIFSNTTPSTKSKETNINDISNNLNQSFLDQEEEDNFNADFFMKGTMASTLASSTFNNSKSSLSNSWSQSKFSLSKKKLTEKEMKKESKKQKEKSFTNFTKFLCIFNVILLFLSCLFLAVNVISTNLFRGAFLIESKLLSIELVFVNSNLNIFSIMCLGVQNNEYCSKSLKSFSDTLFPNGEFNLRQYFFEELEPKANRFKTASMDFKIYVNNYNNLKMIEILENTIAFYFISTKENIITAKTEKIKFVDALFRYSNMLSMLINNGKNLNDPIFIFNITENNIVFDNSYKKALSQYQITLYEFILNYIIYLKVFNQMKEVAYTNLNNYYSLNETIMIIFPTVLLGFHFVLYIMCLVFIKKFESIIETNIQEIMISINEDSVQEYYFKKIKLIKVLSKLLVENPMHIIKEINSLKSHSKLTIKGDTNTNDAPSSLTSSFVLMNPNQNNKKYFEMRYYSKVTLGDKIRISCIFTICFIYLISYIILGNNIIKQFLYASNYISFSSAITSSIYTSICILTMMLLTTRTDIELNKRINGLEGKSYIDTQIALVHSNIDRILFYRSQNVAFVKNIESVIDLDCNTMFPKLEDPIINAVIQNDKDYEYLAFICNSYEFMKFKSETTLTYEIGLQFHHLAKEINITNIQGMYAILQSPEYYSLITVILLIFRPIRLYYLDHFYQECIEIVTSDNTQISVIILVINILMEIVIFSLIKFCLVNRLLEKNKSLILLSKCLKI